MEVANSLKVELQMREANCLIPALSRPQFRKGGKVNRVYNPFPMEQSFHALPVPEMMDEYFDTLCRDLCQVWLAAVEEP